MSIKNRKKETSEGKEIIFPVYTKEELKDFQVFLDGFRHDIEVDDFKGGKEIIRPIDRRKAMVAFGALSESIGFEGVVQYAVVLENVDHDAYNNVRSYKRPTKQELFEHKLNELENMKGREQWVDMKKVSAYEKMAEEMTLPKSEEVFDIEPVTLN